MNKLGFQYDAGTQRWRNATGQFVKTQDAVRKVAAEMVRSASTIRGGYQGMSRSVQDAAIRLTKAQIKAVKAMREFEEALEAAENASTDQEEAYDDMEAAAEKYGETLLDLQKAQNSYDRAVERSVEEQKKQAEAQKGFVGVTQDIYRDAANVVKTFGAAIAKVAVLIGALAFAWNQASKTIRAGINIVVAAFRTLLSPITRAIDGMRRFIRIVSQIAVGVLIRDTLRGIIRELRDMAQGAIDAAASFQTLTVRLENFSARMIRNIDETVSLADSFEMGAERAQSLLKWIKDLSLTAPFDVGVIANTLSLNLAMGFMEQQAKDLTVAIATYTAGMGLSNEVMESITHNFGQMKKAGKVTATEMRDLARGAFFPLTEVLDIAAEKLGVSADNLIEFRPAASEGKIDIDTFFESFLEFVERDFPGALDRFANTFEGVRARFINFLKTVVGLEVLEPIFTRLTKKANDFLNTLLTDEVLQKANFLGEVFLRAFIFIETSIEKLKLAIKSLLESLGFAAPTFDSLVQGFANAIAIISVGIRRLADWVKRIAGTVRRNFDNLANDAFSWGSNIIKSLAEGMVAAFTYVLKALTAIATRIAEWLRGASPPKLLPDLPKWGQQAMTEYLKGFSLADFDTLKDLQKPIEDALRILLDTGKITETQLGKTFVSISKNIAKVIAGDLPEADLFAQIRKETGPFGDDIAELARRQLELARAITAVRIAEEQLEAARKREQDLNIAVRKSIRDYNDQLRKGADPALLREKLRQINAQEDSARAAYEERKAAEAELEAREKLLEIWEEQVQLQKELIDQLIKLTRIQIIQPEQPETGGAGGDGGTEPPDEFGLGDLPPIGSLPDPEEVGAQIDAIFDEALRVAEEFWNNLGDLFAPIGEAWGPAVTSIIDLWEELKKWWEREKLGETIAISFYIAGLAIETFQELVREKLKELGVDSGSAGQEIRRVIGLLTALFVIAVGFFTALTTATLEFIDSIVRGIEDIRQGWEDIKSGAEEFKKGFLEVWDGIVEFFDWDGDLGIGQIAKGFVDMKNGVDEIAFGIYEIIEGLFNDLLKAPINAWEEFKDTIIGFAQEMYNKLVGNSIFPELMQEIEDIVLGTIEWIQTEWERIWGEVVSWWETNFATPAQNIIDGVLTDLYKIWDDYIAPALENGKGKANDLWNELITLKEKAIELKDKALVTLRDFIADKLQPVLDPFHTAMDGIASGINSARVAVSNFLGWLQGLIDKLNQVPWGSLKTLVGLSPSPLSIGIDYASKSMKKMASSAVPQLAKSLNTLDAMSAISAPVSMAPMAMGAGMSRTVNVQMGGVSIANGMDEAMFEAKVKRIMVKSLRG
jgi:tape measure domain-containing protein